VESQPVRNPTTLERFRGYMARFIPEGQAARLLTHYLGKNDAAWLKFLRASRREADPQVIEWHRQQGRVWYLEFSVYAFIAREAPSALDRGISDAPRTANRFGCSVHAHQDIDYQDGVRPFVLLDVHAAGEQPTGLTPHEARTLADQLLKAAAQCESDTPSTLLSRLRGEAFAPCPTSELEPGLAKMLADLGSPVPAD
jgi:hypothetical protein